MNISSIVVKTLPEHLEAVKTSLIDSGLCEIHFSDELGRIVITVEGDDNADETEKLKEIQQLPHVASADFSYSYTDGDPDSAEG
jgi:nitrate reductase NapD